MGKQVELWKARRRGKKRARSDFERDLAQHLHLSVGTPTPHSDTIMKAYIFDRLSYLSGDSK
jgi:hypothetical protein